MPLLAFKTQPSVFLFCVAMFGFLFSCTKSEAQVNNPAYRTMLKGMYKNTVPLMSVQEAATCNKAVYVFLDAREKKEYNVSHLQNALWVGYDDFTPARVSAIPKNTPIVVYCSVGYRSERIGEQLLAQGYTQVYNLYGGIFEWVNQREAVVDNQNQNIKKVHAYSKTWGIWVSGVEKVYD